MDRGKLLTVTTRIRFIKNKEHMGWRYKTGNGERNAKNG